MITCMLPYVLPAIFSPHPSWEKAPRSPPGKSPAKSAKIYTTKILDGTFLQSGRSRGEVGGGTQWPGGCVCGGGGGGLISFFFRGAVIPTKSKLVQGGHVKSDNQARKRHINVNFLVWWLPFGQTWVCPRDKPGFLLILHW